MRYSLSSIEHRPQYLFIHIHYFVLIERTLMILFLRICNNWINVRGKFQCLDSYLS